MKRSLPEDDESFRPADAVVERRHKAGLVIQQSQDSFVLFPNTPGVVVFQGDLHSEDLQESMEPGHEHTHVRISLAAIPTKRLIFGANKVDIDIPGEDFLRHMERGIHPSEILELGKDLIGRLWRAKIIKHGFDKPPIRSLQG